MLWLLKTKAWFCARRSLHLQAFVYLKNSSPHTALPRSTPYEQWYQKNLDRTNIRVFGYPCYVLIPKEKRIGPGSKLFPKSKLMVGYYLIFEGNLFRSLRVSLKRCCLTTTSTCKSATIYIMIYTSLLLRQIQCMDTFWQTI